MSVGYLREIIIILLNHYNVRSFLRRKSQCFKLSHSQFVLFEVVAPAHLGLSVSQLTPLLVFLKWQRTQSWSVGRRDSISASARQIIYFLPRGGRQKPLPVQAPLPRLAAGPGPLAIRGVGGLGSSPFEGSGDHLATPAWFCLLPLSSQPSSLRADPGQPPGGGRAPSLGLPSLHVGGSPFSEADHVFSLGRLMAGLYHVLLGGLSLSVV